MLKFFKKKTTAKDALRTSKREMAVATRGIEREIGSLQLEEKKLVAEIKKTAKSGNEAAVKILARQLIRLRQQIAKLQGSRAQMRGVATHTQAMYANTAVGGAMKGANKAMEAMNKKMEPSKQAKVMQEFQRQSAKMDMTTEMMSDSIDDALDNDDAEEETDELTNQIGVDIAAQLSSAPRGKASKTRSQTLGSSGVDDLEQRLAALRHV
ncbi:vacuolar protein sorting-associated protein 2 homolog 3 isoform X2 [Selaginella moellendorffii]|uniref:vacuolar protein sorting-associated protein 2 homolog 3 isoform X2 n=1 Tax=Selaginella moellendorffii TaxID=88036 RepID=UPI000D1CDF49|nr:vacuolar protein sorting-associated protein 2 homolog 3 isoform X2 [Selaginella moellendorffii]|eukprot:XP_024519101.1 vacuolar protein sorting-associated protein 2 homolog 3 isoform X2 [Selaginella moellendorffii]